ncbi:murein L,D-transpeptidase [Sulfitobacter sp. SK012]|nr:L,D-transpeptidase family protein [Sulfitobacter sp. SK012]AXI48871.1 murein L,D-transpeptidase [Sulfitobacter sp. SK012]
MLLVVGLTISTLSAPSQGRAQVTAFKQAVAEAASQDADIAAFYRGQGFTGIWTEDSEEHRTRRAALITALRGAASHGLPTARYDHLTLQAKLANARTARDQGLVEVEMTRVFLKYARDVQTGALIPSQIDSGIVREVPSRNRTETLSGFVQAQPASYLRGLAPRTMEYNALMKQKLALEALARNGGWGPVVKSSKLEPGQTGNAVVQLRNRLMKMGYLRRSNAQAFDVTMRAAVQQFQTDHGLEADGVAGPGTLKEINKGIAKRLQSVVVAMERERWFNTDRGDRHILVNLPDFTAKVIDDGRITFQTRSVIGAGSSDRKTPEFSDVMEFMVINPSWYVPRSIVTKEYLPAMQRNAGAASHLIITDRNGRQINRGSVNFNNYNARNFPYSMRQPPSRGNALGLVKFMFPNKYNIYLHDTPAKKLFSREVRAFSHGCVRLNDPFDFAYTLLAKQTDDPEGLFQSKLRGGKEVRVILEQPVPVHIIYRTAFTDARGEVNYRRDIYGRDALIWGALQKAGVALSGVQG